jgi:hypothetical protein
LEAPFALKSEWPSWDSEFAHYASLYREGLNSNSTVYRFLCLFKIIEGIRFRRARLGREAAGRKEAFSRPVEVIPDDPKEFVPWLNAIFPIRRDWDQLTLGTIFVHDAVGKRFAQLISAELNPLRDKVAHAILKSGEIALSADELLHVQQVNRWLPVTRCMVRRMLKNEFPVQFLSYLKEDGTIQE